MYDQFKNQFILSISNEFDASDIKRIIDKLNMVAHDYAITKKSTEIATTTGNVIPKIVKTYLVCKRLEGLSEQTLYNYGHYLQLFFEEVGKEPDKITSNDIRVFLYAYQEKRGVSNRSLDKYRTYIASFYQWAVDEEYLTKNPTKSVKPIKYESKPRQALTQLELEYLRIACQTDRERAMVEFLYSTGCRISELSNVKISDIDWKTKQVTLFGKGKKYRTSYLNAKAEVFLKKYLESRRGDSEYLFTSAKKPYGQIHKAGLERIIRIISDRSRMEKNVTPHILRHTTATLALNNGMPVADISKLLGHSNISTTMIYAHTSLESVQNGHKKCVI